VTAGASDPEHRRSSNLAVGRRRDPNDWTFAYDNAGTLHGAVLRGEPRPNVYQGMTTADRAALNLYRL
jgi:hypothetical protein